MAIELRKSLPDPELNSRIWGTTINPESYYRVLGEKGSDAWMLYDDVLKSGAIRGSGSFSGDAYFAKGAPQGIYLHSQNQASLDRLLQYYSQSEVGNNNFFIEATTAFDPETNPLYEPSTPRGLKTDAGLAGKSYWKRTIPATGEPVPLGTYVTAHPAENTSFLDRINPANQKGLRMGQAYTPEFTSANKGFAGGKPPDWKWLFDYTKGFTETSIPQHGRNVVHIGKTILAQPETQAVLNVAGDVGMKAGGASSFLLEAPEFTADEYSKFLKTRPEGYSGPMEPSAEQIAKFFGIGAGKSILNAATLGMTYSGTGKNRPKRGLGEMEASSTDMYRRLKERGDEFLKKDLTK